MATHPLLDTFETYGWSPDSSLTDDENFMDLVLIVTRSSQLQQGSMACILARLSRGNELSTEESLIDRVVSVATNRPLYEENQSDIHAEINAIGQAAQNGNSTDGCTAYITMPPCKRCFAALLVAGIRRIVSRHECPGYIADVANQHSIQVIGLSTDAKQEQRSRINSLIQAYTEKKTESDENGDE